MTLKAWFQGPMFRLNIVVLSSLALLAYGLRTPSGPIEVLQLPVAAMQVYFIVAVVLQVGVRGLVAPLTTIQRGLIGTLVIYMIFVSATSPVPSAHILVFSWIIHIFFFVALLSFFESIDLEQIDATWSALGLAAFVHVCAFLFAWAIWPDEIRRMNLPAFGHIRHLSYLLAPAAAIMALLFVTRHEKGLLPLICFSAAVFYILYTGSRGGVAALLGGFAATGAYLAWYRQHVQATRMFILLGVTAILVLASEMLPAIPNWPPVFGRGLNAIDQAGSGMLTGRDDFWRFAWLSIQKSWIWGYGPVILSDLPRFQDQPFANGNLFYHPHNVGFQFLLHWGALGTLLILATASSFAANVFHALRRHLQTALVPFAIIATMGIHALVDGNFFYPFSIVIAMVAIAMLEAIGRRRVNYSEDCS